MTSQLLRFSREVENDAPLPVQCKLQSHDVQGTVSDLGRFKNQVTYCARSTDGTNKNGGVAAMWNRAVRLEDRIPTGGAVERQPDWL